MEHLINPANFVGAVGKLSHFIVGGDLSAGGILHAVTSVAQTLADADAAYDMEAVAVQAMRIAATA